MSYPLIGAIVGSCVGGPLGCLAGAKVGVFATVTCFVLGKIKYNTYLHIFNKSSLSTSKLLPNIFNHFHNISMFFLAHKKII